VAAGRNFGDGWQREIGLEVDEFGKIDFDGIVGEGSVVAVEFDLAAGVFFIADGELF